jgi:hypothetical protein
MDSEMTITQCDNGWILNYNGHDYLEKTVLCKKWNEVLVELEEYFGWYDFDGHLKKTHQ